MFLTRRKNGWQRQGRPGQIETGMLPEQQQKQTQVTVNSRYPF